MVYTVLLLSLALAACLAAPAAPAAASAAAAASASGASASAEKNEIFALEIGTGTATKGSRLAILDTDSGATRADPVVLAGLLPMSTDAKTMVSDAKGTVRLGMMDLEEKPTLVTVSGLDGVGREADSGGDSGAAAAAPKVKAVQLSEPCLLWQMVYDAKSHQLYGMSVPSKTNASLFRIDPDTGKTRQIGLFPFFVAGDLDEPHEVATNTNAAAAALGGDAAPTKCYDMLNGGAMVDDHDDAVWIHFAAGKSGTYVQKVSLKDASVQFHGYIGAGVDLSAPVWGDKNGLGAKTSVLSIAFKAQPPYTKRFARYDVETGKVLFEGGDLGFFTFFTNEATLDHTSGRYTAIMGKNITSADSIVTIDAHKGTVLASPPVGNRIFFELFAAKWL